MHTIDKRMADSESLPFAAPMKPRSNRRFRHTQRRGN